MVCARDLEWGFVVTDQLIIYTLYTDLDNITVHIDSVTANSTNVTINCYVSEYNRDSSALSLTLMQGEKTVYQSTTYCNTTKHIEDLQSGTNYTLTVNREFYYETIICELSHSQFKTKTVTDGGKS